MADEPNSQPEDIQGILSELDAILSGVGETLGSPSPAAPAESGFQIELGSRPGTAPPPKPVEPPAPIAVPKAVEPPKPVEPPAPIAVPKAVEPPKPVEPPAPAAIPKAVEPPKLVEPPAPAAIPKAVEPPKPVAPPAPVAPSASVAPAPAAAAKPAPVPVPMPAGADDTPREAAKDQIRRIAYVYTFSCLAARDNFAAFLSQAARTISKKPLYLRQVMSSELSAASDPYAVFEKARDAKAVAVLAVVDGWPPAKIEGLSEACARGGLLFRAVASGDVQKKSTAVDVIVDMMLLPGEA